jgi:hypothetical protein
MNSDDSDDERDYSQGDEIYPNNNDLLPEGEEIDVNDYPVPDYYEYDDDDDDGPRYEHREENIDLLELFVEYFNNHDDFIKTAERRNNTSYNLFPPTPGNLYLVISRKLVFNDDMDFTPNMRDVDESKAYIGRLTSLTRPNFESPTTYEFSKLCKLKNLKNGIITSEKCQRDATLTSNYREDKTNTNYKLYCFPITESAIRQYFPSFERLTLDQRIAATQAMKGLPFDMMKTVLSFSEYNTPGPATIRNYPGSTAETRGPDPTESPLTEEEFEKMHGTKRRDTKGGKKTKRRKTRRRTSRRRTSRKNRKPRSRRHK